MTIADEMMMVLKDEEAVLKDRKFEDLAVIQRRKEQLLGQLEDIDDQATLQRLKDQAERNERLMAVALTAIRGLRKRVTDMATNEGSVGYSSDGTRMGVEGSAEKRRV